MYNINFDIVPSFALYVIDYATLPPDIIYDRANLASKNIKGSYFTAKN